MLASSHAGLIKMQNAFAYKKKIEKLKDTLGSETFWMYSIQQSTLGRVGHCVSVLLALGVHVHSGGYSSCCMCVCVCVHS